MVDGTDGAVGCDDEGDDEERERDDAERFTPRKAYCNDAGGELPGRSVEGVRDPVCCLINQFLLHCEYTGRWRGSGGYR